MTFKEKLKNFWYYYKYHTFAAFLILVMLFVGFKSCVSRQVPDMYALFITDDATYPYQIDDLAKKLENYVDDVNGDNVKRVQVIVTNYKKSVTNPDAESSLVANLIAGKASFLIFDSSYYKTFDDFHLFGEIDEKNKYVSEKSFLATKAGFFEGITGFDHNDYEYSIAVRNEDNAVLKGKQTAEIQNEVSRKALNRILNEYK